MTASAVVIGYGPGMGAAIARAFAAEGMALAILARDAGKLDAGVAALRGAGAPDAAGIAVDATDADALRRAMADVLERFGTPTVLVYNASLWRPGPTLATNAAEFEHDFRLNVGGALVAALAVAPGMKERGAGTILFTGGGLALYPSSEAPSLSVGKAGVRALALLLAQELAPAGVKVGTVTILGAVAPGTPFDPDRIAEAFVRFHHAPLDPKQAEVRFTG